ncbi:MAG: polysaccharide deacetylase family protein [Pyrinomonadaceae bacterium]
MSTENDISNSHRNGAEEKLKVPILTYHSIDSSGSVISTAPDIFRRQMKYLSEAGYNAIPLRKLAALLKNETALPSKTVVLTFDDGFRNFYTEAFSVLSEYNFKATVFLVTDFCGKQNNWLGNPPDLPRSELLSWQEVRELNAFGIEFGSHTKTHPDLTKLTTAETEAEVVQSKAAIADALGRETSTFAYPFGRHHAAIRRIAVANFDAACSTDLGKVTPRSDFSSLNRIDSYYLSNQRLFEMLQSATFDNYMRFRQVMRNVKSLLPIG